jgi:hypothetical protein
MRFSIRDLFLVTMIVAILTAWWVDHRRWVPTDLTNSEVEALERKNKYLKDEIDRIDRQLAGHGLQLEVKYSLGLGGRLKGYLEVVPLPNSSAPAPNPPKR